MLTGIVVLETLIILWLLFERDGLIRRNNQLEGWKKRPDVMGHSRYRPKPRISEEEIETLR